MFKSNLFICLLIAAVACAEIIPSELDSRIAGGEVAKEGQFPYQVSFRTAHNTPKCNGAIIGARWVLTAARCVYFGTPSMTTIAVGSIDRQNFYRLYNTTKYIPHQNFDINSNDNDIGLLQIEGEFDFTDLVSAVPLSKENIGAGVAVTASGWGEDHEQGSITRYLMYYKAKTLGVGACDESQICIQTGSNDGLCEGDAGDPLVTENGIVGVGGHLRCNPAGPQAYARVAHHAKWIEEFSGIKIMV